MSLALAEPRGPNPQPGGIDWSRMAVPGGPSFVPPGYVSAFDALDRIGSAIFGAEWTGHELLFCPTDLAEPTHKLFAWYFEHGEELLSRKRHLWREVQLFAAGGVLQFAALNQATGSLVLIERERWNCEPSIADGRLALGRINLVLGEMMRPVPNGRRERAQHLARMSSWLFVAHDNLAHFLKLIAEGAEPPVPKPVSIPAQKSPQARDKYVGKEEVKAWVRHQIKNGITQSQVARDVAKAFPGRLVRQNREAVRDIYREEYARVHGLELRPGKRSRKTA